MDLGPKITTSKGGGRSLALRDGFHVDFGMFLDRPHIAGKLGRKGTVVLNKTGGFTRYKMKNYVARKRAKKRKRSKPGEPPLKHEGSIWRTIFYGASSKEGQAIDGIIVGPIGFAGSTVTVPQLLNEGGTARITLPGGRRVTANYLPRPFATAETPPYEQGLAKMQELMRTVKINP